MARVLPDASCPRSSIGSALSRDSAMSVAADLLEDHRQLHQAEPEPSVGLGQRHARPALIRGCLPEGFVDRRLGLHQLSHTGHLTVAGEESTR